MQISILVLFGPGLPCTGFDLDLNLWILIGQARPNVARRALEREYRVILYG